jgi:DUF1680 family protein
MFLLHGDAKYIDVLERVLYNGLISGVSLSGDRFFYQNPLESKGRRERSPWFEVACCPGNIVRFIPSFPGYIYAQKDQRLYVNLFVQSGTTVVVNGQKVSLSQETRYPWEGHVTITIDPEREEEFAVLVRIPGWAQNEPVPSDLYRFLDESAGSAAIRVNDTSYPFEMEKGFAKIRRKWKKGDRVELILPMPIRRVGSHEKVQDNQDKMALQRGPIVYCFEGVDNEGHVLDRSLAVNAPWETRFLQGQLGGLMVIEGSFSDKSPATAVPYYAWAHRGADEMAVWMRLK